VKIKNMDKGGEMATTRRGKQKKSGKLYPTGYLVSRYTLVFRWFKLSKATMIEFTGSPSKLFGQEADVGAAPDWKRNKFFG
jgi:hypothetical protein